MHIHTVFFWLKDEVSEEQRVAFGAGCAALASIASVRDCKVGTPIACERAVVDDTFSLNLNLRFDNTTGHDAYQVDPKHDAFVKDYQSLWEKVVVYDSHSE
jgi:hypothetical protein